MKESTQSKLTRLLSLAAYLASNRDVQVEQASALFDVDSNQILKDVNLLWLTGTPGYFPEDLVDFDGSALDNGRLVITQPQGLGWPLSLNEAEAIALAGGLNLLQAHLSPDEIELHALLATVKEKLAQATGFERLPELPLEVASSDGVVEAHLKTIRQAISLGTQISIDYVSSKNDVTTRLVDPYQLRYNGMHWYLDAWCNQAGAERVFRVDGIINAELMEGKARPCPANYRPQDDRSAMFVAELKLKPEAWWVGEGLPQAEVLSQDNDGFVISIPVFDAQWFAGFLLSIAPSVISITPPELGQEVVAMAKSALAQYGEELG